MTLLAGQGITTQPLTPEGVQHLLTQAFATFPLDGKRVLVIIPDGTRTAPIPLLFRLLYEQLGKRVAQLDYLIALGTHPPMDEESIERLVGVSAAERSMHYPNVRIFDHRWDLPTTLQPIGVISREETARFTDGLLMAEIPIRINRLIDEYDQILICGPVFPLEVVGFSGGAKYLFPGIAGGEIIDFTHWLAALVTNMNIIGVKDTPVRRIIDRATEFVQRPLLYLACVMQRSVFHGLYIGTLKEAFSAAADLSAQLNIMTVSHPFQQVLSMPASIYADLWTAGKAMYKLEPVVSDGGEVIIYAPAITEISYTHGKLIDQVGYHVRDCFLKQWSSFQHIPWTVLGHSSHVKGAGHFDPANGGEVPRIQVTLATGISRERCKQVNLGYLDHREIDPQAWMNRTDEGILVVPRAGEMLYRVGSV